MQIGENANPALSLEAKSYTATANGTAVDCSGYDEATWLINAGTFGGTSPTADLKIQESATSGGTYTDITGAAFTQITTSNDVAVYLGRCRVSPSKPFQRAVITVGGTSPTCLLSAEVLRHRTKGLKHPVHTPSFQVTS